MSNVAIKFSHADLLLLSFSGRAPPCRQGSADITYVLLVAHYIDQYISL